MGIIAGKVIKHIERESLDSAYILRVGVRVSRNKDGFEIG
jgi:hypothetical protein